MVYVCDDDDLGDELDDCGLLPPRPCGWGRFYIGCFCFLATYFA